MLAHKGTATIETKRLILRPYSMQDAEAMFVNYANDPEVTKFLTWEPHGKIENTVALLAEWVPKYDDMSQYNWGIVLKQSQEIVGGIGAIDIVENDMRCEVGYCVSKFCWGQGIMSEALAAVLGFLFTRVGFNRIQAKHDLNNPASGRVMEKNGMKREGVLREFFLNKDIGPCDLALCSILKSEYVRHYS